ncbi:MAG TPA: hypothetical protein VM123_18860 [archaeon]|nr:hypothetical protein [archaeon]
MNLEKSAEEDAGKQPDKSAGKQKSGFQGSIFSRNLELSVAPVSSIRPPQQRPEEPDSPIQSVDRGIYFKVEAGKVLDILKEELERRKQGTPSLDLLEDLYGSWITLWGNDRRFPAGAFTEMLEIAYSILQQVGKDDTALGSDEGKLLAGIFELMSKLISGEVDERFLDSNRHLVDKYRMLAIRLKTQSERQEAGTEGWPEMPAETESRKEIEPDFGERTRENDIIEQQADISDSVDEWFSQVSSLIAEPKAERKVPGGWPAEPGRSAEGPESEEMVSAPRREEKEGVRPVGELEPVTQADTGGSSVGEKEAAAQKQETERLTVEKRPPRQVEERILTERLPDLSPPVRIEWRDEQKERAAGLTDLPVQIPEVESAPDIVGAYFKEHGKVIVEIIRNNLASLGGRSTKRTSQRLARYVDELFRLAEDFEYESLADPLRRTQRLLAHLAVIGKEEEMSEVIESLSSLVDFLEQELESVGSPVQAV